MTARPCRAHALPACAECATLSLDFVDEDGYPRDRRGPAAHTEAIRLLDEMAAAPDDSGPLVRGGQGRSAEEILEAGIDWCLILACLGVAVVFALVVIGGVTVVGWVS